MTSENIGMNSPSTPHDTAMNRNQSHSSKENESLGFILARYSYLSRRTKDFSGLVNKLKNLFLIFKENKLFNEVTQKRANLYTEQSKNQVNSYVLPLVKKHLHMGKLKFDDNSFQENTQKIIKNVNKKINKDMEKTFKKLISDIKNNRLKFNNSIDKNQLITELKQIAGDSELTDVNLKLILNKINESGLTNPKSPNYAKLIEFQNVTKEDLEKEINFYRNETARINLTTKGVAYKNKSLSDELKNALTAKDFDPNTLEPHLKNEFEGILREIHMSPLSVNQLPLDKMDPELKVVFNSLAGREAGNSFRIFVNQLPQVEPAGSHPYLDAFVLHRFVQENLKETVDDLVDALVNNEEDSDQVSNFLHTPYSYENDNGIQLLSSAVAEARNAPGLEPKLASLLPAFMVATVVEQAAEKFALDPDTLTKELHAQDGYKASAYQLTTLVLPALESFHIERTKEDPFQGLNEDQVMGLHLLTQMMRGELEVPNDERNADENVKYLTQAETKLLEDFLKSIPGNKQLNSALTKILDSEKVPYGMSFVAINFLRTLSFKTINLQESQTALGKLSAALTLYNTSPDSITDAQKISLSELGVIDKAASLYPILKSLNDLEILPTAFGELFSVSDQSVQLLEKVNEKVSEEAVEFYKSGDTLSHLGKKESEFKNRALSKEQNLTVKLVSPSVHLAKLVVVEGQVKKMEVMGSYIHRGLNSLGEMCFSTAYRWDIGTYLEKPRLGHANIDPFALDFLKLKHGENWQNIVQTKFESGFKKIERMGEDLFEEYRNTKEQRFKSANPLSHLTAQRVDPQEIWRSMVLEQKLPEGIDKDPDALGMICSQFDLIADIFVFHEFNRWIAEDLHETIQNLETKQLLGLTLTQDEKKLLEDYHKRSDEIDQKAVNKTLIRNPFSEHENLTRVNPGRNLKIKKRTGAYREIPRPKLAQVIVRGADDIGKKKAKKKVV